MPYNRTHTWVPEIESIGKLLYLVLQVYEHIFWGTFWVVPQQMSKLYTIQFLQYCHTLGCATYHNHHHPHVVPWSPLNWM